MQTQLPDTDEVQAALKWKPAKGKTDLDIEVEALLQGATALRARRGVEGPLHDVDPISELAKLGYIVRLKKVRHFAHSDEDEVRDWIQLVTAVEQCAPSVAVRRAIKRLTRHGVEVDVTAAFVRAGVIDAAPSEGGAS